MYQWKILYFYKSRNSKSIECVSRTLFAIEESLSYWPTGLGYNLFANLTFIWWYLFIRWLKFSVTNVLKQSLKKRFRSSCVVEFCRLIKTKVFAEKANSWWHHRSKGSLHSSMVWKILREVSVAFLKSFSLYKIKYDKHSGTLMVFEVFNYFLMTRQKKSKNLFCAFLFHKYT